MSYTVKERYLSLQGEGMQAGRVVVLCRMAGCNLWSGRQGDRESAVCKFCDTEFVGADGPGGGRFESAALLAQHVLSAWPRATAPAGERPVVLFTGGEPLLQVDEALVDACHALGMQVAIETNGTREAPPRIDWTCVSPKAGAPLVLTRGDELKLVYPQAGVEPSSFEALDFRFWLLQPMDGPDLGRNTRLCVDYCLAHPKWRLSVQLHKLLGIA